MSNALIFSIVGPLLALTRKVDMKLLKKTAIIISLITSTTGFAFADGHEAPGSG